ncbi:translation termination inhibitor protein itt1 [Trapelia coarctata]|nr:translation termination inhibitor protein itt1 [Trapelia coarctata]
MADLESTEDDRAVELSTLAAIFPELTLEPSNPFSASIELPVSPATPLAVIFASNAEVAIQTGLPTPPSSDGTKEDEVRAEGLGREAANIRLISHLPPLMLRVTLPTAYPSEAAPIIHLESQSSWLPDLKVEELRSAGGVLWEEIGRDQVVFTYIDHLQQAAEDGFGLNSGPNPTLELSLDLEIPLLDYDLKARRAKFEQETFECGVCLEPKKGAACHRLLLCSHVFCIACLQDFYNACITEGDVANVKCLALNCGKETNTVAHDAARPRKRKRKVDRTLDPSELLQIPLEQETVQRYVKLKRKNLLESDRTTVYCPRQWCQGAARSKKHPKPGDTKVEETSDSEHEKDQPPAYDPNSGEDKLPPPSERLAICEDCSFAFCKVCKASWHGEFAVCFPRRQHELTAEEKASLEYLRKYSTACPTCDARCQKTMGCNHMICFKCNSHFCYLCSAWLAADNPYKHFNTLWTPCYMRLWELEEGDGTEVDRDVVRDAPAPEVEFVDEEAVHVVDIAEPIPVVGAAPPLAPEPPAVPQAQLLAPQLPAAPRGVRVNARVQQGLARPRQADHNPGRGPPVQGLQRFLQLVENDEEDEWDSDELDEGEDSDQDDRWVIPIR